MIQIRNIIMIAAEAAIAAVFASSAVAQTIETNCQTGYGNVRCTSMPTGADYSRRQSKQRSYEENEVLTPRSRALAEKARALRITNDRAELPSLVGGLVAKGTCGEAEQVALKTGDFELAQRTHSYCAGALSGTVIKGRVRTTVIGFSAFEVRRSNAGDQNLDAVRAPSGSSPSCARVTVQENVVAGARTIIGLPVASVLRPVGVRYSVQAVG
ncbi:hypothetical protein [Sphingomonas sp. R86521]|uniref:hypothetical protein n=1 Tax=Sphingomonas sp. R86521 TaxID=3093860 RepID=UPI0036D42B39